MKVYDFSDCEREGLLRAIPQSREKAEGSIRASERWLRESEAGFENETFSSSAIASYLAMFHSARAILFLDGFREKSHFCIGRYLEEKFVKKGLLEAKWVQLFDHYRELRNDSQYDISFFASEGEAGSALKTSREFVERMRLLVESRR